MFAAVKSIYIIDTTRAGAVAERLIATVLKTVSPTGDGGSNPSCSVIKFRIAQ